MLSICIPGFERPQFLRYTLSQLERDFPTAEIVISDDASASDMSEFKSNPRYRWIQQPVNIGPFPNMLEAFKGASGDYCVYCANDDYLLPYQIEVAIEYLEEHKDIAAYVAPMQVWDEVEFKPLWNAFKVPSPITFAKNDAHVGMNLFNYIIQNHIWPEHIVYRAPVPLQPRTRAYWCFADIPHLLEAGGLHFAQAPFSRNLLIHPVGVRVQLGNIQCLTHFDEYRAGLELMAYGFFGGNLPFKLRHQLQAMIQSFICSRMAVARTVYKNCGDMLNADMLDRRLAIADPRPEIQEIAA